MPIDFVRRILMTTPKPDHLGGFKSSRRETGSAKILEECCQRQAICRLHLVHCDFSAMAKFAAIVQELVEIQLPQIEDETILTNEAICCISFTDKATCLAFLGCLVDVKRDVPTAIRLVITFPPQMTISDLPAPEGPAA